MSTNLTSGLSASQLSLVKNKPKVTVAITTYNGVNIIPLCLKAVFEQTYLPTEVIVIDNASTDGTTDWIKAHYPQVQVIHLSENRGPNPSRNLGVKKTPEFGLTLLIDDDAVLEKNCLLHLVQASQLYPDGAVWAPKIVYYDKPNIIQHSGTFIHYTAEAILVNSDQPVDQEVRESFQVDSVSGTCLLLASKAALDVGLFDEDYFFGRTDGEFTFRLSLSGYPLYVIPQACCFHRVKTRGLSKVFYQIRNRWYFILTIYSWWTLVVLSPALMVYELSLIAFLGLKGRIGDYLRAMVAVAQNLPRLWQKRQSIQALKVTSDRDLLRGGSLYMREDLIKNKILKSLKSMLDVFFEIYWKIVSPLL